MAIYKSKNVLDNARFRPDNANEAEEVTCSIFLPAGYTPVNGDIFVFGILGENVQLQQASYNFPAGLDTNATAALAAKMGFVTYAGAGGTQTYVGSTAGPFSGSDTSIVNTSTVVQGNTGLAKAIARLDGEATAVDSFSTSYVPQGSQMLLIATFTAAAGTAGTVGANGATISASFKYQYAYPNNFVTGVTGVSPTNLLGTKQVSQAVTYQYGYAATPNAP